MLEFGIWKDAFGHFWKKLIAREFSGINVFFSYVLSAKMQRSEDTAGANDKFYTS